MTEVKVEDPVSMPSPPSPSTAVNAPLNGDGGEGTEGGATLANLFASPPRSPAPTSAVKLEDDEAVAGPSRSPSPIGTEDLESRTATAGASVRGRGRGKSSVKREERGPILISDLPTAWDEAHETFDALPKCVYERKDLGLSREQDEMMVCDCSWDKDDPHADPCGPESDCINRALFIECLADECRAGRHCRNQQFSKHQYADIEVVLTEKKGYGLRAAADLPANTLVYEYIGEVVAERTFRKRMQQYAEEGIRHFYFMMLQKEEYIDATKKGGIGRFANHSCNPNSEVQKWVVGRRLRMGIFTKRDVVKGEEITFNYNVDRYGHDAQICYCGEANCVGTIGGKTQTDIGTMNDLFLDALGITDEVEAQGLKGSKKKKAKQLDEDFVPTLRPIEEHEVQKVAAAIRQSMENTKMMSRLLQRIKMSDEPAVQRQLMRMHGFSLMSMILTDLAEDREIVLLALESLNMWKLQYRNKIEDSKIEEPVAVLRDGTDEQISELAKKLLEYWSTLELSYKIPRVSKIASLDEEDEAGTTTIAEADSRSAASRRLDTWENTTQIQIEVAPVRPRPIIPSFHRPRPPPPPPIRPALTQSASSTDRLKLDAIIALAQQTVQAATAVPSSLASQSPAAESSRSGSRVEEDELDRRKRQKRSHYSAEPEDDDVRKERRLTKLVGDVVVRSMSKYKEQMEHDTFKRYAKECTQILVEKEKKGHSYATSRHPTLTEDKKAKIKSFTKEFAHKVLKRLKEKGKLRKPSFASLSASTPSTILATPTGGSVLDTPQRNDRDGQLVNAIFGADDIDVDMDLDDDDGGGDSTLNSLSKTNRSRDDDHDHDHDHVYSPTSPLSNVKSAPISVRKNGGYTVERLDLASLGKINGVGHPTTAQEPGEGQGHGRGHGIANGKVPPLASVGMAQENTPTGTPSSSTLASGTDGPSPTYG